jgi:acetyltransferase
MYSSFGNEADVSMNEIIDYYGQDEDTRVIMTHIETLKDPAGFLEVANRVTQKKPILALKTGKTSEGAVAVASHTGSLMEQDTLTDAIFKKAGVLRFHSQEDMIDAAVAFSNQPVPPGDRVVIVTNTGGPAIIAVDECISAGLKLAKLSAKTKNTLKKLVFQEAIVSNPVDVVATAGPEQYGGTVEALLKDPNIDSVLLVFVTAPFVDCEGIARKLGELGKTSPKPIVCQVMTIEKWQEVIRLIRTSGIPVYDFAETAARALAAMTRYGEIQRRPLPTFVKFRKQKKIAETILGKHKKEKFLPQEDVYNVLKAYGIPAAKTLKAKKEKDVIKAANDIGYPLVLKVDAESIVHKSDVGGVAIGLSDESALLSSYRKMAKKFAKHKPSFVLQEHLSGGKEVILGSKGNEGLAPTVMFGIGGVFVEVLKDVQFRLAPLSREQAVDMIQTIKGYPILEGTRGEKPVDIDAVVDILLRLSELGTDFPQLDEMDLNPVLVFPKGKGAAVVDARIKHKPL